MTNSDLRNRIVLVTDAAPPQVNGVVRTLEETCKQMVARGIIVTRIDPSAYRTFQMPGYKGLDLAKPPYGMRDILIRELRQGDATAIHIATEGPLGFAARRACLKLGLPFTTAYHTQFPEYLNEHAGIPEWLGYAAMRWFHGPSKAIMVPTPSMAERLRDRGFKNVVVWGRGVDTDVFRRPLPSELLNLGPRPVMLNVGRVSPEKNLDAFLSLAIDGTKVVVGDGPDLDRLKELYPDTVFLGVKHGTELAAIYGSADVFVFPSKTDTFGLVMAEAISCGVPVAAYDVTGPKDVIRHGITGWLSDNLAISTNRAMRLPKSSVIGDFNWEAATTTFIENLHPIPPNCNPAVMPF